MPNWCKNGLHVRGEIEEVKRFLSKVERDAEGISIIKSFIPCPNELTSISTGAATINGVKVERWRETGEGKDRIMTPLTAEEESTLIEKFGAKDWYEWEQINWGVKWGDCGTELETEEDDYLCFLFDSAWGSPHKAFDTIAKMFPMLRFNLKYGQGETEFEGYVIWRDGKRHEAKEWAWERFDLDDDYDIEDK